MRRLWSGPACLIVLAVGLTACSSSPGSDAPAPVVTPGCHTAAATVHLALSDTQPVPVVRTVPDGCVAVRVPRSPFAGHVTEVPTVTPDGRLHLVSDTVSAGGVRTAYYRALRTGTVTVSSTVTVQTNLAVPEWSGLVVIV
jgi:hypothetical protein